MLEAINSFKDTAWFPIWLQISGYSISIFFRETGSPSRGESRFKPLRSCGRSFRDRYDVRSTMRHDETRLMSVTETSRQVVCSSEWEASRCPNDPYPNRCSADQYTVNRCSPNQSLINCVIKSVMLKRDSSDTSSIQAWTANMDFQRRRQTIDSVEHPTYFNKTTNVVLLKRKWFDGKCKEKTCKKM